MALRMSNATVGIAGHAGIGHTHCPGGLIQDDTAGFGVAGAIIRELLDADTRVKSVEADPDGNTIRVTTVDGGTGEASPRRGITPSEARMIAEVVGRDALLCQTVAIDALGRMYGQGVLEVPTSLAAALANATIDTFRVKAPGRFHQTVESVATNFGLIGGLTARICAVNTSVMATVNACKSGIGPNEDMEGNVPLGAKGELMKTLGMMRCPTIVLEGKAYSPAFSDGLTETTLLVRCQKVLDNIVVAQCLHESAKELGYPVVFVDDAFPRHDGSLRRKTAEVAERIIRVAECLRQAGQGTDKVLLVAELARLVSEECGGVSFMTDSVHDAVRQVGMIQGTSAVLSMLVTKDDLAHCKIPLLEQADIDVMKNVVYGAIPRIVSRLDEANGIVGRLYEDLSPLERLL